MAYIGKKVEETELDNRTVDTMTGDGSDTTMSLSATPISVNNVLVFLNGVMQRPTTDFTLSGSTITFAAAPFTGAVVVAITGEGGHIGRPSSPLPTEKFMNSAVTNAKISGVAASKLTGSLPALDGAALTGGPNSYTESTSDPAINTNPSTGVGTFWVNKSSGEVFCCTDATAGENVWYNVGGGDGDVQPFRLQGTQFGFCTHGNHPSVNMIQKYSYTTDENATDVANLSNTLMGSQGGRSATHGYAAGGEPSIDVINKYAFAGGTDAVDIGNLTAGRALWGGQGSSSGDAVYWHGGQGASTYMTNIDKRVTASDGNATIVGNLSEAKHGVAGGSSSTHGYACGGNNSGHSDMVERYAFASDGNAVDTTQNLLVGIRVPTSSNSTTHVYIAAGHNASAYINTIQKFAIDSSSNSTDVGDLDSATGNAAGTSSTTHGYMHGGYPSYRNVIQKYSFSVDGNSTDVGDLVNGVSNMSSSQH